MCNHEHLVAFLYDDLAADDRASFEAHIATCDACRQELAALRQTRQQLAAWSPPQPALDNRVVRGAVPVERPRWAFLPPWGLAAAASVLVLAGALGLANLDVRIDSGGIVVRTGWGSAGGDRDEGTAQVAEAPLPAPGGATAQVVSELRALEGRLRELEASRIAPVAGGSGQAAAGASNQPTAAATDALEARVRRLVAESERRQRTELALQVSQVWKDFNAVRASDAVRVQESLDRVQGQTNYQLRQHRDSIQSLYRVSLLK